MLFKNLFICVFIKVKIGKIDVMCMLMVYLNSFFFKKRFINSLYLNVLFLMFIIEVFFLNFGLFLNIFFSKIRILKFIFWDGG